MIDSCGTVQCAFHQVRGLDFSRFLQNVFERSFNLASDDAIPVENNSISMEFSAEMTFPHVKDPSVVVQN